MNEPTRPLHELERILGIEFHDRSILAQAMTHRSYLAEATDPTIRHNEKLEFLGDAVLQLAVTRHLLEMYPGANEGKLSRWRMAIVCNKALARASRKLGLIEYARGAWGSDRQGLKHSEKVHADLMEALIGALYEDQGIEAVQRFVADYVIPNRVEDMPNHDEHPDVIDRLKRAVKKVYGNCMLLTFRTDRQESRSGNASVFVVGAYVGEELLAQGEGRSIKLANRNAAAAALQLSQFAA